MSTTDLHDLFSLSAGAETVCHTRVLLFALLSIRLDCRQYDVFLSPDGSASGDSKKRPVRNRSSCWERATANFQRPS